MMEVEESEARPAETEEQPHHDFGAALSFFYKKLYPFKLMHQWLSYNSVYEADAFARREFSFTSEDDMYTRHLSFPDAEQWQQHVVNKQPYKIDIGAVYSFAHAANNVPVWKEMIFDIDMDDYASVRTCCEGKRICRRCWAFMATAIRILEHSLREYFGFVHLLFVFSGRRGVHCWVADQQARELSDRGRRAILDFLSIRLGSGNRASIPRAPHPAFEEMRDQIVIPMFEERIVEEQGVLETPEAWGKVLAFFSDAEMKEALENKYTNEEASSDTRWQVLKATIDREEKRRKRTSKFDNDVVASVAFTYCYPRFDSNVSVGLNHLLKSPFCVHPATGKVCVPVDPRTCEDFNPDDVPTLSTLLNEIDRHHAAGGGDMKEYKKTSLKPYIEYFKKSFLHPLEQAQRIYVRQQEEKSASF